LRIQPWWSGEPICSSTLCPGRRPIPVVPTVLADIGSRSIADGGGPDDGVRFFKRAGCVSSKSCASSGEAAGDGPGSPLPFSLPSEVRGRPDTARRPPPCTRFEKRLVCGFSFSGESAWSIVLYTARGQPRTHTPARARGTHAE
jgi:hypothetical protein